MNPGIIAHIIIGTAISAHNDAKAAKLYETVTKPELERYYMSYFIGQIIDENERTWLLEYKIRPKINQLSGKEAQQILKNKQKNEKLLKKGKQAKYTLVQDDTIKAYHQEYLQLQRNKAQRIARAEAARKAAMNEREEARIRNAKLKAMHDAHTLANGESDAEVISKLFT